MKNITTVAADDVSGGTFFSWTLEYLSGKNQYWGYNRHNKPSFIKLTDNPLTFKNAHAFMPNDYPFGLTKLPIELQLSITDYMELLNQNQTHLYGCDFGGNDSIKFMQDNSNSVFRLVNDSMFHQNYHNRHLDSDDTANKDILVNFIETWFSASIKKWDGAPSIAANNYNLRELLSLNIRPYDNSSYGPYKSFDSSKPHMLIHFHEIYHYFDIIVHGCFEHAGLTIDLTRFEKWVAVWQQWRKMFKSRVLFQSYLDVIVDYIVKGYDMDLTRFKLDIIQQAVIMHELLRKYNLGIAGYGVNEFTSTAQIHALLEPSIHVISNTPNDGKIK